MPLDTHSPGPRQQSSFTNSCSFATKGSTGASLATITSALLFSIISHSRVIGSTYCANQAPTLYFSVLFHQHINSDCKDIFTSFSYKIHTIKKMPQWGWAFMIIFLIRNAHVASNQHVRRGEDLADLIFISSSPYSPTIISFCRETWRHHQTWPCDQAGEWLPGCPCSVLPRGVPCHGHALLP